jgi:N-acetyl-anhydromuramyl-L-alanine amidase AmpD
LEIARIEHRWVGPLRARPRTRRIILHHAASAGDVSAETIHTWHQSRGWIGIGYHFVIRTGGSIEAGRPEHAVGAHAKDANLDSIGICLAGNLDVSPAPEPQIASLVGLVRHLLAKYPGVSVVGHGQVNATACPGRLFPWTHLQAALGLPDHRPLPAVQRRLALYVHALPLSADGYLIDSTGHVPLRALAEHLGIKIDWIDGTIRITGRDGGAAGGSKQA